jgi:anti-anti-sigma factor
MAGIPEVRARVASITGDVELDCSGLTFLDAAGLGVLLAAHRDCQARDAMLTIVDPSPRVAWLLALTGLDGVLVGRAESSGR